ncbi:MAG: hypothetical protein ABIP48_15730, partial [Planctomycetota bacterium]
MGIEDQWREHPHGFPGRWRELLQLARKRLPDGTRIMYDINFTDDSFEAEGIVEVGGELARWKYRLADLAVNAGPRNCSHVVRATLRQPGTGEADNSQNPADEQDGRAGPNACTGVGRAHGGLPMSKPADVGALRHNRGFRIAAPNAPPGPTARSFRLSMATELPVPTSRRGAALHARSSSDMQHHRVYLFRPF